MKCHRLVGSHDHPLKILLHFPSPTTCLYLVICSMYKIYMSECIKIHRHYCSVSFSMVLTSKFSNSKKIPVWKNSCIATLDTVLLKAASYPCSHISPVSSCCHLSLRGSWAMQNIPAFKCGKHTAHYQRRIVLFIWTLGYFQSKLKRPLMKQSVGELFNFSVYISITVVSIQT